MKRYRVFGFDFDARASFLRETPQEHWDTQTKELHKQNYEATRNELLQQFGSVNGEQKLRNFVDLENAPLSIIAFHNKFFRQVRNAFVIGAYYPALTGACALGERILNHLILKLRDSYMGTPEYKQVYDRESFDDWKRAIRILVSWDVLQPAVATAFFELEELRNRRAIHFNPETDHNDRELALDAINLLSKIIYTQFAAFGAHPWFIRGTPGCCFIKKEFEAVPFIREVYIPNCVLVGPNHVIDIEQDTTGVYRFIVRDPTDYEDREITDEEFAALYNEKSSKQST